VIDGVVRPDIDVDSNRENSGVFPVGNRRLGETLMEHEEGLRRLSGDMEEAQIVLLRLAESEPGRWWTATELADRLRAPSSSVVMIALYDLVKQHKLELDPRLRVRLPA
jgi:hypothetical protein